MEVEEEKGEECPSIRLGRDTHGRYENIFKVYLIRRLFRFCKIFQIMYLYECESSLNSLDLSTLQSLFNPSWIVNVEGINQ